MRGEVVLVIVALGVAGVGSILLWTVPRLFRRRPPSFREQLAAVSPQPGKRVGPAAGVSVPTPLTQSSSSDEHPVPTKSPARARPAEKPPPQTRQER